MNKTSRFLLASWLVVSGTAGSPTPCIANAPVTLKSDIEISRQTVRLSDLFLGVPSEIDRDIAQAPLPCKPAIYDENVLNQLAKTYRLDWKAPGEENRVTVSSACSRITGDMIREAVTARIKKDMPSDKASFEVVLDARTFDIALPTDKAPSIVLENFTYDSATKNFRADLRAQTPRGPYALPIKGSVLVKRSVPVLSHRLESGTTISESDLDWIQIPEERITADIVTEPKQLIGREVRRDTPEAILLRSHDVIPQRLVQRGSLVTLKIETPFILITSQGKALQDGAEGDTIRVTNTQSNRIVEGVVTAPGIVEVRTSRKIALAE